MNIIGYGEDALTYWVLTQRLDEFLNKLGDRSKPQECLLFYRPSFGRRGGENRAEFGEFDSIVATPQAIYLIESKWDSSSETRGDTITLHKTQEIRHDIFRWYFHHIIKSSTLNWETFIATQQSMFKKSFNNKLLAPPKSVLSENIMFVIDKLSKYGDHLINVLLYIHKRDSHFPKYISNKKFRLITMEYDIINNSYFFKIP